MLNTLNNLSWDWRDQLLYSRLKEGMKYFPPSVCPSVRLSVSVAYRTLGCQLIYRYRVKYSLRNTVHKYTNEILLTAGRLNEKHTEFHWSHWQCKYGELTLDSSSSLALASSSCCCNCVRALANAALLESSSWTWRWSSKFSWVSLALRPFSSWTWRDSSSTWAFRRRSSSSCDVAFDSAWACSRVTPTV